MKHRHNWKYLTGEKLQLSACECGVTKPMKRIKKECNCHCHNEFHWFINDKDSCAGITECPHCSPKPMKRIKKEVEKCHCCEWKSPDHLQEVGSCNHCPHHCSPKPTKIEKLVIKEDWSETTFEQQKDRLHVHMRYFEDDDSGGKWEGGSSSFSVPLKKLKDYLLSH